VAELFMRVIRSRKRRGWEIRAFVRIEYRV
jgi:hypothetical protein